MKNKLERSSWLTVKQASQIFPFSESALRWMIFKGQADFMKCLRKVGRKILINSVELENWINEQEVDNG